VNPVNSVAFRLILCALLASLPCFVRAAETPKKTPPPQITFSTQRGWFEAPFTLTLTSPLPGTVVRYTLNASVPGASNGIVFASPLLITNTALVRAAVFSNTTRVTAVATHTYLFIGAVLHQPTNPPGLPVGPKAWNGTRSAYEMDARIVDATAYRTRMKDALRSLPVLSLVSAPGDFFGPRGLYVNTMQRGKDWERPCSTELILTNGATAFQIDCGIRVQGNMNRDPESSPKHSFRLVFKEQYGAGKLNHAVFPDSSVKKFDTLVLRADYNNSWAHWDPQQRPRGQRIRDAWLKDSARAMGWSAPHSRFVHLFLNGLYWGVYDITERPDASFAASYFGGSKDDYDVINEDEAKDGTTKAFEESQAMRGLSRPDNYKKVQRLLNVTNFIDYLLLNYYADNRDWGHGKNWYALRRHTPPGLFHYVVWDGEHILNDASDDLVNRPIHQPFELAQQLKQNADFRRLFSERVQKHCFSEGALTASASMRRWMMWSAEVDLAMIAESARWGYYHRNPPFTHDEDWLGEQRRLVMNFFPQRTSILVKQLAAAKLYVPNSEK
jgi:hypothetical protein